jgi:hypothetical protein
MILSKYDGSHIQYKMVNRKVLEKNKKSDAPNVATEMENEVSFWLAKYLKSVTSGSVEIYASDKPALKMKVMDNRDIKDKKININFLEPELFNLEIVRDEVEENVGFFDKLKNAFDITKMMLDKDEKILSFSKKFAQYLTDNDVTLSFSRKGKEAITIGKEAKPTLSRLLTKSDDVQIKSPKEAAKLTDDVLTEE